MGSVESTMLPIAFVHCRVFGKRVSEKEFQAVRALRSQVRSFLPPKQKRDTPRNFEMKRLFRNAFSERSKRSEKERDKRSLHTWPMFPGTSLFTCRTQKGSPGTST